MPLNVEIDKHVQFDFTSCHGIQLCSSITVIIRIIIVHNTSFQSIPIQLLNIITDIVQHISADQFQSAIQSHPHGPWQLNGMVLSDVSEVFQSMHTLLLNFLGGGAGRKSVCSF